MWWIISDSNRSDILSARQVATPSSPITHIKVIFQQRVKSQPRCGQQSYYVTLPMALPRKYQVFNLSHAVTVPTQISARLVHPMGFEPMTPRLKVWCYFQLSYGCNYLSDSIMRFRFMIFTSFLNFLPLLVNNSLRHNNRYLHLHKLPG